MPLAQADAESKAQIEELHKQHDDERQQIIDILKNKYTKRIDKWKARVRALVGGPPCTDARTLNRALTPTTLRVHRRPRRARRC